MAQPRARAPRLGLPAAGDRRDRAEAEAGRGPTRRLGVRVVAGPWLALPVGRGWTWGGSAIPVLNGIGRGRCCFRAWASRFVRPQPLGSAPDGCFRKAARRRSGAVATGAHHVESMTHRGEARPACDAAQSTLNAAFQL